MATKKEEVFESDEVRELIGTFQAATAKLRDEVGNVIIGQEEVVEHLLITLLVGGHCLITGMPGTAKTLLVQTLADSLGLRFKRIQFTPDLMPTDVTGTDIIEEDTATGHRSWTFVQGPIFTNVLLADEINRTPPKTQAALLEAMQERSVTVRGENHRLEPPFFVLATQNPIELEGTYPLPEAQLDRFLMHVQITYPEASAEKEILHLARNEATQIHSQQLPSMEPIRQDVIFEARNLILDIHMAEELESYLIQIVLATRELSVYGNDIGQWVQYGASPRATIALDRCARAHAWLQGKDYVAPDDIQAVAYDVLRHRLILNYEAEAEGIDANKVISELIARIAVP